MGIIERIEKKGLILRVDKIEMEKMKIKDKEWKEINRRRDIGEKEMIMRWIEKIEKRERMWIIVIEDKVVVEIRIEGDEKRRIIGRWMLERKIERIRIVIGIRIEGIDEEIEINMKVEMIVMKREFRMVERNDLVMSEEEMEMRVRIGEDKRMENIVRRKEDEGKDIRWREGGIIKIGEIVLRVEVKLNKENIDRRIVGMGK